MTAVKYPRTPHLPHSPGKASDDKVITSLSGFENQEIVTTEKLDGSNITLASDIIHARSVDSGIHRWDAPVASIWATIRQDIPLGWRVSGESLYARRSVAYNDLPGYFIVFGIWNEKNELLSWDETIEWANLLNLPIVPVLYRGHDFEKACEIWHELKDSTNSEGFVIRVASSIPADQFKNKVAKYVRADHVRTAANWRHRDDFFRNTIATE
jgi:hypothetical protein